jgi:hypothetical protein
VLILANTITMKLKIKHCRGEKRLGRNLNQGPAERGNNSEVIKKMESGINFRIPEKQRC